MKNGMIYGSFNPLNNSHIGLIREGLKHFDVLHIFVRSEGQKDLVDYETKKHWLETLGAELGAKINVYPFLFPEGSIRQDGSVDLVRVFTGTQDQTGGRVDGLITGGDKAEWIAALKPAFPDREFVMLPVSDMIPCELREHPEMFRENVPAYVYATLTEKANN